MKVDPQQLKALLINAGLLTADEFDAFAKKAAKTGKRVADLLIASGKIKQEDYSRLQAHMLGIPFVDLENVLIDPEVLRIIPEPVARRHNIVAFRKSGRDLEVAMLDPEDLETIDFIRKKANLTIKPRLTDEASLRSVLAQYRKSLEAEFETILRKEPEIVQPGADDLPIVRIADTLLRHAILQRASDIHIEPREREVIVRYRIDGILHDAMTLPANVAGGLIARIKVLANLKLDEHRLPQDGRFKIETEDYNISFRVSIIPIYDGEKAVLRLLLEDTKAYTLQTLGFHGEALERIHAGIRKTVGMILATGPTGSGKTTTLYTVIDLLNKPEVNISTIEDPIEYHIPRVNQTQVKPDIGYTFANGLRALVRQDPDIIMVGEIRDNETASLAVNAALTGHLVLSTLHTNSAAGALPRLMDMRVEPFLITSTVEIIIAQRLVRQLCPEKEEYYLSAADQADLAKQVDLERVLWLLKQEKIVDASAQWKHIPFFRPKPTPECADGYRDRIGIHEVLIMSSAIKEMIMKNMSADEIDREARKEGMITMAEDGIFQAARGITTIEEILRVMRE
ncbi:MAG: ATPase, T2SS/T4P/T4SS family [Patescibacteria group bacterium]